MDEQIKPVAWRAKTPHGWVVGKTQHSSYDEPLYSQQSIDALRAEVERLRALAGCAYQMAGMHDAPLVWLDRLSEAANGDALPDVDTLMDELLPYQPDVVCEAEARADKLRAEVATWEGLHASEVQARQRWQARAERAEAEAEALRADAERYRWLCDGNGYFMEECYLCGYENEKARADAAIDAARKGAE